MTEWMDKEELAIRKQQRDFIKSVGPTPGELSYIASQDLTPEQAADIVRSRRIIAAPAFLAWWKKLNELAEAQPDNTALLDLIDALVEVGRNAGAVTFRVQTEEPVEPPLASYSMGDVPDPSFDWVNGGIDFLAQPMPHMLETIGPNAFIQSVADVTGIPAQYAVS